MTDNSRTASASVVTLTQLMGPGHANILGNVHGGHLMKLADEAGGMAASKHAGRSVVTVTVDSMSFHSPVHIGELVTFAARVTWVGRTSMETKVVVQAENIFTGVVTHTNTAYIVYVALDETERPTPVPRLVCETEEEQALCRRAEARQAYRLEQRRQGNL